MSAIDDFKKELKDQQDKKAFLKERIEKHPEHKSELRKLLIEEIKSAGLVKTSVLKKDIHHTIIYDSLGEGMEHIYFWFLDFLREKYQGLGMEVSKTKDDYEASVTSSFFGEQGARATRMQEQAMKMMQTINTVVRSMVNIIYDLKEFEIRLDIYKKYHSKNKEESEAALLSLKQIWMDQVDIKRGRGSINNLAQQLQFVTLRDAFLAAKSVRDIDRGPKEGGIDLNERVKRILKPRLLEAMDWIERSDKELTKRYNIEKSYLKSQIASLKLYTIWAKPYLKAAQQLGMREFSSPDIVNAFNNMILELALFAKSSAGKSGNKEIFGCIEVVLRYRTVPMTSRTQQGVQFIHSGRTRIDIKAYSFSNEDLELLKEQELFEGLDLIEEMVGQPLSELREDIDKYLKEEKEEEKEKNKAPKVLDLTLPFRSVGKGFKDITSRFKHLFKIRKKIREPYTISELKKKAANEAKAKAFVLYDVYKKTHGMLSWT